MTRDRRPPAPPAAALRLLAGHLPLEDRDAIAGDLTEMFADRVDTGRRFNRMWFWCQAIGFVLGFATTAGTRVVAVHPPQRREVFMGRLSSGFRHAVRRLAYEWRYAAGVVGILAVGIGPAAAMLSIVEKVWLRPIDYRAPDQLGIVRINLGQIQNHPGLCLSEITDLRKTDGLFAAVEAEARATEVSLGPPDHLESLTALRITPGLFPMIGVEPVVGRVFTDAETNDQRGFPVVIDYGLWQSRFGAAADVTTRSVLLDGIAHPIVGVMPKGFVLVTGRSVPKPIDVYAPLQVREHRNFWGYPTLVRVKAGVTFEQVNAALVGLTASLIKQYPQAYSDAHFQMTVRPVQDDMLRDTRPALRAALGGVLLLLLIAVANATALVVARLKTRERDLAIRSAIGAGRGALVSEVLMESVVLSCCGALAGTSVAALAIAGARALVPHTVPRWDQIALGWELVGYATAFAVVGLFAAGLIPVWKVSRGAPWQVLRTGGRQGGRAEGATSRLLLVGAQIALTVVLAFGATQLVRSAARLSRVDVGFDPNVLTVRVPVDLRRMPHMLDSAALYQRLRDRLRQIPTVTAAGGVSHLPLSGQSLTDAFTADLTKTPGWDLSTANYYAVTPGFFSSMRIPILQGRDFTDVEDAQAQHVIIVDRSLARVAFPGEANPIGRTLKLGWGIPDSQIVGVVGTVRAIDIARDVRPQIYTPYGNFMNGPMNMTVRADGDPSRLVDAVQTAIYEIGTGRAPSGYSMLSDNVAAATSTLRSVTGLVSLLAISAGLLSAVGLYTVIAFVVHQRRRATAIRSALGASRSQLVWHHLRTSGAVMLAALPIGAILAVAAAPSLGALLYGLTERDVASLLLAVGVAAVVGLAGTYLPVRRAAETDPVMVLRGE